MRAVWRKTAAGLATALTLVTAIAARAEVTPQSGLGDPHIQSVAYDPQQVVGLHVAGGYAVTVQFSPEERIETVTLGNAAGWSVQVNRRADHLVVKPAGVAPPTNLTVISDQRTYNFTLYGATPGEGVQPYLVSFTYPPPGPPAGLAQNGPTGRYKLRGDRSIWPQAMSDDGRATAIRWAAEVGMPAIYREGEEGQLALVNGVMRDGAFVVEGVYPRLVLVLGKARARAVRLPAGAAQ